MVPALWEGDVTGHNLARHWDAWIVWLPDWRTDRGGVVFTQEEPWISDSFPRARKAGQSEALFAALRLPSWLSPFPRNKVSPGGTRLEYPRDRGWHWARGQRSG